MAPRSEDPKLIIRVVNFELVQPICSAYRNVTDRQTDRQTDRRTIYDSNTALALRASRGKNVRKSRGIFFLTHTVDGCLLQIMDLMRREVRQPIEYTATIGRRYDDLITSKAELDIDALVERNPSFDEFGQELRRYAAILENINYNTVKVIRIGMFEVYESW